MGLLTRQKYVGPFVTPHGRRKRMYVIFFMIVIVKTTITANICSRMYATSRSSLSIRICRGGVVVPHYVYDMDNVD